MALILDIARQDDNILGVVMYGSRVNPRIRRDSFQDFDIVYLVKDINVLDDAKNWIDRFGEPLIVQIPGEMILPAPVVDQEITYLMLFKDWNRIDLIFRPIEDFLQPEKNNPGVVLLDKTGNLPVLPEPSEEDYLIQRPTAKEFRDCCNEFWWLTTYVAKGLCRNEITFAKSIFETPLRDMFMYMIQWHIGIKTNFTVSFGKRGRHIKDHVDPMLWEKILATYPDGKSENIWKALLQMTALFRELALPAAKSLGYRYREKEDRNVMAYLTAVNKGENP